MKNNTNRGLIWLLGVINLLILFFIALLLSEEKINISFLNSYVEDKLSVTSGRLAVKLEKIYIAWNRQTWSVDIHAENVHASIGDHDVVVVPELLISMSGESLLHGQITLSKVRLDHPNINLRRDIDKHIQFSIGKSEKISNRVSFFISETLHSLPESLNYLCNAYGQLHDIEVDNADLVIDDEILGIQLHVPKIDLQLSRNQYGISGKVQIKPQLSDEQFKFNVDSFYNIIDQTIQIKVSFDNICPSVLMPSFQFLSGMQFPVNGSIELQYSLEQGLHNVQFDINGGEGTIDTLLGVTWLVKSIDCRGTISDGLNTLNLDEFRVNFGESLLSLSGKLDDINEASRIEVRAFIENLSIDDLKKLWPSNVALNLYTWIVNNISKGRINSAVVNLLAKRKSNQSFMDFSIVSLDGKMLLDCVSLQYLSSMPKVQNIVADAQFDTNKFTIDIKNGDVSNLKIDNGTIVVGKLSDPNKFADIDISLKISGSIGDVLNLIGSKPLSLIQTLGVQSTKVKGDSVTLLNLKFPLIKNLNLSQIKVQAKAQINHLIFPNIILDLDLSGGDFTVFVDSKKLNVSGSALLNGIPANILWRKNLNKKSIFSNRYQITAVLDDDERHNIGFIPKLFQTPFMSGKLPIDVVVTTINENCNDLNIQADLTDVAINLPKLNWKKQRITDGHAAALVHFVDGKLSNISKFSFISGNDLDVSGNGSFENGQLSKLVFNKIKFGRTDIRGKMILKSNNDLNLNISGVSFDGREIILGESFDNQTDSHIMTPSTKRNFQENTNSYNLPSFSINAKLDQVWVSEKDFIKNVTITLVRDHNNWKKILIDGKVESEESLHFENLFSEVNNKNIKITSDNAGSLFKKIGIYKDINDGKLSIIGSYDDSQQSFNGKLTLTDFQLVKSNILMRLLATASITGIFDLLQKKGIFFNTMKTSFNLNNDVLTIKNAKLSGLTLGLTANGQVDFDKNIIKLDGTIIPFNIINNIPSKIPIINLLLVNKDDGGMIAINYSMSGSLNNPSITINPLSSLTPNILKIFFNNMKQ
ncbi:MAG: DUF3971 domain-containing protein [Rhodospirillaceae bacterium]|nr:DUF3971 domain-containing protein [Rhodospirillaceae bacterium]